MMMMIRATIFALLLLDSLPWTSNTPSRSTASAFSTVTLSRSFTERARIDRTAQLVMSAAAKDSKLDSPPFRSAKQHALNWKQVAQQAAAGCQAAFRNGHRRVSVDIPQISSVDRSTTARKFEDDNNFLLNMIAIMGSKNPEKVGSDIQIKMGGFEGGGDYLSEEGLYGYQCKGPVGTVTAIGNSEIDGSALRDLNQLNEGSSRILLFNTNLDRLSFFDKLRGLPNFDDVKPAYLLFNEEASAS